MNLPSVRIKKILYATDLSETAAHAFAYATSLASMYGAKITILYVLAEFPGEEFISNMVTTDTWKEIRARHYSEARNKLIGKRRENVVLKEVLEAFSDEVRVEDQNRSFVTDEVLIINGKPAEVIVETAKDRNCDLIVMGTHGQGAIADVLIGSTAKWVVRKSPIPVLVIRVP